jgi:hypothetical protein
LAFPAFCQLEDNLGQPAVLKRKPRLPEQSAQRLRKLDALLFPPR